MVIAKLLTPARGFAQANCGDIFSPKQYGNSTFALKAVFLGIMPPSLKVVDVSTKTGSCGAALFAMAAPFAMEAKNHDPRTIAQLASSNSAPGLPSMMSPPKVYRLCAQPAAGQPIIAKDSIDDGVDRSIFCSACAGNCYLPTN